MVEIEHGNSQRLINSRRRSSVQEIEAEQQKKSIAKYVIWFSVLSFFATLTLVLMFDQHLSPEHARYTRMFKSIGKVLVLESFGTYIFNKNSGNLAVLEFLRDADYIDNRRMYEIQHGLFDMTDSNQNDLLDEVVRGYKVNESEGEDAKHITAVEIGTFVGYNTFRLARSLPESGRVITCEADALTYSISNALVHFAGLQKKISLYFGHGHNLIRKMHLENQKIDFLLLDQSQNPYLEDFILAEKLKILADDAIVVSTNSRGQHDGEFSHFIQAHPSYQTEVKDVRSFSYDITKSISKSLKSITDDIRHNIKELNFDTAEIPEIKINDSEEITVSRRKLQDWGPYRSTPEMKIPGNEDITSGHYFFYPDRMIFMNELGRTPEYQSYVDGLMNKQYHQKKELEQIRKRAKRIFRYNDVFDGVYSAGAPQKSIKIDDSKNHGGKFIADEEKNENKKTVIDNSLIKDRVRYRYENNVDSNHHGVDFDVPQDHLHDHEDDDGADYFDQENDYHYDYQNEQDGEIHNYAENRHVYSYESDYEHAQHQNDYGDYYDEEYQYENHDSHYNGQVHYDYYDEKASHATYDNDNYRDQDQAQKQQRAQPQRRSAHSTTPKKRKESQKKEDKEDNIHNFYHSGYHQSDKVSPDEYHDYYAAKLAPKDIVHNKKETTNQNEEIVTQTSTKKDTSVDDPIATPFGEQTKNETCSKTDDNGSCSEHEQNRNMFEEDDEEDNGWVYSERTSHDSKISKNNFKIATKALFDSEEHYESSQQNIIYI